MLRVMALCETETRALLGAVFGPVADCETSYAEQLLHLLDGTMLLLDDRRFDADDFLAKIAATGAQMLVRLNSRLAPARWAVLDDGSYLTRINGVRLRIIDAQVTVTASGGLELGGEYRQATTLLDPRRYPAAELVALYYERREIELVFYSLRCALQRGLVLRSQDPRRRPAGDLGPAGRLPGTPPRHDRRRRVSAGVLRRVMDKIEASTRNSVTGIFTRGCHTGSWSDSPFAERNPSNRLLE